MSYGTAAALVLGISVGGAGPASAAEPLEARLVPDPLATNGASFVLKNITNPDCEPSCPTATAEVLLSETSWVDATFDRNTTELALEDAFLEVPDFELVFGPLLRIRIRDVSVGIDTLVPPASQIIGADGGPFAVILPGLINAVVSIGNFDLPPFVDTEANVPVEGTFTFDPILGTFAITDVGGEIVTDPIEEAGFKFDLSGSFELNFIATGVLDVFGDDFEDGNLFAWSSVVPPLR